jgi:hypothetical protein
MYQECWKKLDHKRGKDEFNVLSDLKTGTQSPQVVYAVIIVVPTGDPRYAEYSDLSDLPEHILKEIAYLFETYKALEGKQVRVLGWNERNLSNTLSSIAKNAIGKRSRHVPRSLSYEGLTKME